MYATYEQWQCRRYVSNMLAMCAACGGSVEAMLSDVLNTPSIPEIMLVQSFIPLFNRRTILIDLVPDISYYFVLASQ
jgi:hypothetical protein